MPNSFDPKRDAPKEGCVVTATPKYVAILNDDKPTLAQRAEALRFLVHFVADAHQPLHAGHAHDKGGNDIKAEFLGDRSNLHKDLGSLVIRGAQNPLDAVRRAAREGDHARAGEARGRVTDPAVRMTESHRLAEAMPMTFPLTGSCASRTSSGICRW